MDTVLSRYRNLIALALALSVQVVGLAVQVKRSVDREPTRLIRIWTVNTITPLEKSIVGLQSWSRELWSSYLDLRGVRRQNEMLKSQIDQMRLEQVRLGEDARQAHRLQVLLGFKEQYLSQTVAAQVVGSSGSEQSRAVYIDKGQRDGVRPDMPVITAEGIVGKTLRVYASISEVLLLNDQTSGVGAILETSRLQGVIRGTPSGTVELEKVMSDEKVQPGERVLTSGGDRIFPKGLPVGTVTRSSPGSESFLNIRVKPSANLARLEEVLVVTKVEEKQPSFVGTGPVRAIDILAERLPSVPPKPEGNSKNGDQKAGSAVLPLPSSRQASTPTVSPGANASSASTPESTGAGSSAKPGALADKGQPSAGRPGNIPLSGRPSTKLNESPAAKATTTTDPAVKHTGRALIAPDTIRHPPNPGHVDKPVVKPTAPGELPGTGDTGPQ
ncbi:MAG: rod shape-determining protein MreC [Acidobacteriales bacterium]|nr:rod shape-determining protein MreC [Terriglobales bacterium]